MELNKNKIMKCHDEHNHDNNSEKIIGNEVIYTCPMHSDVQKTKPGLCPDCGMNLIPVKKKAKTEHDKHAGHKANIFLKKFWVSLTLTIFVVAYSDIVLEVFGWQAPIFPGSRFLAALLGSIVFFYGGWIFIIGAIRELRARLPGMMTLIALAISAAYLYSVFVTVIGRGNTLFWELTTLITIMLLGHFLEMKAVKGAQSALKELSKLLPDTAELISNGESKIVPISELKVGDVVFVRPGSKMPADGVVIDGRSNVDESMVTGESKPVLKQLESEAIAGTINGEGSLKVKVAKIGESTFLAGVMRLVEEAQASKSKLQILSDRAAFYLTIIAVATGTLTFVAWIYSGAGIGFAMERLVAVLVIACPHALGLAVPLIASISTTMAAKNGLLVKRRLALEAARNIDIVIFDKTGTLTKGEYGIQRVWAVNAQDENEVLRLAASVDSHSEHFISKAIVNEAKAKKVKLLDVKDFVRIPGKGVRGIINGEEILVGGAAILENANEKLSGPIDVEIKEQGQKGQTIIFLIRGGKIAGVLALADVIREESRQAIIELKNAGKKVAMLTGDSEDVAKWVAEELKIDEYFARVLPQDKSVKVRILQEKGYKVAMVGDGINDAPALTQADLGIAIGAGTNVAVESAGIILVRNDPRDIVKILRLSRLTHSKMIQNLFWATGYNVVALPLAAGILFNQGIILQPAVAALFMSLSTVIVAVNAWLLNKKKLG